MRNRTVPELETHARRGSANLVLLGAMWMLAVWTAAMVALGQDGREAESLRPAAEFLGPLDCDRCHSRGPSPLEKEQGLGGFVTQEESKIWISQDKHSLAFKLIDFRDVADDKLTDSQRLSKQMCEHLGIADIHAARQCLSCHANWVAGSEPPPFYVRGVTCESCHGASSLWTRAHAELSWRQKSPQDKHAEFGFVDVRDPVRRAEQCFACHIGNSEQGKIVTHAMYVAGHPPLPGIEIEHFVREMPPHWQYLNTKEGFQHREEYVRQHFPYLIGKSSDESYRTRAVVLGGVVALRENVKLFLDQAARSEQPDLAAYECFACHHELKTPSWRQTRSYVGRPGRPAMREWPTALVKLGIFHASTNDGNFDGHQYNGQLAEFSDRLGQIHASLSARPFGEPEQLRRVGTELVEDLNLMIGELEQKRYDRHEAVHLMKYLCREAGSGDNARWHDYDSARQVGWALRSIYAGVEPKPENDEDIQAALKLLTDMLRLDLPSGQERQITAELDIALVHLAAHEPEAFHQQIDKLGELLPRLP